jgi:transposase
MQGKKTYSPKLFTNFNLSTRVSEDNFYRRLKQKLDLNFLYKLTKPYYGDCGQKGVDPVVFFKLLLVGYLENLCSDRKIIDACQLRLDILYFIDHDIDDELPWHSTLSRTRQRIPEDVFQQVFNKILQLCIEKGMVKGKVVAVDSALIKANASLESLEVKNPLLTSEAYLEQLQANTADEAKPKASGHTKSNDTKYSPSDPEARMATKPGKGVKFSYLSQVAVDASNHVIIHAQAFTADKKDSQCLQEVVNQTEVKLSEADLKLKAILSDTNYSSAENYQFLKSKGIDAFIPLHGQIKLEREGFVYDKQKDRYICRSNKELDYKGIRKREHGVEKRYSSHTADCRDCPFKKSCLGKEKYKTLTHSIHRSLYEQMQAKVESDRGKMFRKLRSGTVEPVLGSLIEYYGLRKIGVKGRAGASKVTILSAASYNLKKYLKFRKRIRPKVVAACLQKGEQRIKSLFYTLFCLLYLYINRKEATMQKSYPY